MLIAILIKKEVPQFRVQRCLATTTAHVRAVTKEQIKLIDYKPVTYT